MNKYQYPTKIQRGLCFIIDALIVGGLGYLIAYLIIRFSGFNDYYQAAGEAGYAMIFQDPTSSEAVACIVAILYQTAIYAGVYLVIVFLYLILLPYFTSFQTLGRLITKTRLIARKTVKLTMKHLLLRELVGEFLIYILLTLFLQFMNMIFYISVGYCFLQDISIPDLISKTKMVSLKVKKEDEFVFKAEEYQYSDNYDWEGDNEDSQEVKKEDENAVSEE